MTSQTQKQEEREALETFLECLAVEHTGFDPGESPDFLLSRPTGRIGVELVRTNVERLMQQSTNNRYYKAKLERALCSHGVYVSVGLAPYDNHPGLAAMPPRQSDRACKQIVEHSDVRSMAIQSQFDAVAIVCPRTQASLGWARWLKAP